jgi:hypothetical protein
MAGGAITWRSKKQITVTMSSMEAEYVTLSEAGHEACWLRNLYAEPGFPRKVVFEGPVAPTEKKTTTQL